MKTSFFAKTIYVFLNLFVIMAYVTIVQGQTIPYVSYPIDNTSSDTERPDENQYRNTDLSLIVQPFSAIAPNASTPASQVACFPFLTDFSSSGGTVSNNVILDISIVDESNASVVFADTLTFDQVTSGTSVDNSIFNDCFLPDGSITEYTGTYSISSDCIDPNPNNNTISFQFDTNEDTFAKETGGTQVIAPASSNWGNNEPHNWAYGNCYFVSENAIATEAIFSINAITTDVAGRLISVILYKWIEDTNQDGNMDIDEREEVGIGLYQIEGVETPNDLLSTPLLDYNDPGSPVLLDAQTNYVLMLEYVTFDQTDLFLIASTEYDYSAQIWASASTDTPRYASMLGIGLASETHFSSLGFGGDIVPVVRLVIEDGIVDNVGELYEEKQVLAISPNPVSDFVNIQLSETEQQFDGQLMIYDQVGRLVNKHSLDFLSNQAIKLDVSYYTNGVYFAQFVSDSRAISGSFIVKH